LNLGHAWLVFQKDWSEIKSSKQILIPIIVLPLVIVVLLPTIAVQVPALFGGAASVAGSQSTGGSDTTISLFPSEFSKLLNGMSARQSFVYMMATVVFAPFTLLVPLLVSSIISSDSFAGEKERKTIEALLATPLSDTELLVGKILVALIPALTATWGAAAIYIVLTDLLDYPLFGYFILPNLLWIAMLLGLAPAFAIAAIGLSVIISSRVSGAREAQQLSGILVIPIVILMIGEISGIVLIGIEAILAILAGVVFLDYVILRVGLKLFNRERILSKL
jgi:ABC-2 type transport system permease protein